MLPIYRLQIYVLKLTQRGVSYISLDCPLPFLSTVKSYKNCDLITHMLWILSRVLNHNSLLKEDYRNQIIIFLKFSHRNANQHMSESKEKDISYFREFQPYLGDSSFAQRSQEGLEENCLFAVEFLYEIYSAMIFYKNSQG